MPPETRSVAPTSIPCSLAIVLSTGHPGANCIMTKLSSIIPNNVGIISIKRLKK